MKKLIQPNSIGKYYLTTSLEVLLGGQPQTGDGLSVLFAGEDLINNRMMVTLLDWSDWEQFGWKTYLGIERKRVEKLVKSLQSHLRKNKGLMI